MLSANGRLALPAKTLTSFPCEIKKITLLYFFGTVRGPLINSITQFSGKERENIIFSGLYKYKKIVYNTNAFL